MNQTQKKRIGIIGATGYTGSELVRLLVNHPQVEITAITSESRAGERFSDVHPFFSGIADHKLTSVEDLNPKSIDLAFLALPHGVSMEYVKRFSKFPFTIIDLSGDFRLDLPEVYEEWYQKKHSYPEGFQGVAYGIPELFAEQIKTAKLIANPGCYPTSAILGLAPLFSKHIVDSRSIIIDSKSGVTGTGVKSKPVNHFSSVNDNFKAYGLKNHRHSIEIQQKLQIIGKQETVVQFTPHLLPVDRGILSTMYLNPITKVDENSLHQLYHTYYDKAPFVRLRSSLPAIKDVRGTNYCDVYFTFDPRTGNIIVISAIDNLVKGAAGQAIQNMNVSFGWDQKLGLHQIPMCP